MQAFIGIIGFMLILAYGLTQLAIGFIGIEDQIGSIWAWIALALALFLRFTLPITIGAFFGATEVLGWHWALALIFVAPGLLIMIPGMLAVIFENLRRR